MAISEKRDLAVALSPESSEGAEERELLDASRRGDVDAWARVYGRYRGALYSVCLAKLRCPSLAEDVVQETFVRAFTALLRFDPDRRLWPWLVTIAGRRCTDLLRGAARTSPVEDIESAESASPKLADRAIDSTVDAVLAAEERERLGRALASLPARQRRALLLHALEGWEYAEIATAERSSVSSVKSLIFRARMNLRAMYQTGALGIAFVPFRRVRERMQRAGARFTSQWESVTTAFMQNAANLGTGALAVVFALSGVASPLLHPAPADQSIARLAAAPVAQRDASRAASLLAGRRAKPMSPFDVGERVGEQVNPNQSATPERTQFDSIVVSPNYTSDRTIFAAGRVGCLRPTCSYLFVSRDGGSSWQRLPATSFLGGQILLPPNYPVDRRIFAMSVSGLQISKDDGDSFESALSPSGNAAVSPTFAQDQRILIGATPSMIDYWAHKDLSTPAPLPVASLAAANVAFSPNYGADGLVFIGGTSPSAGGVHGSVVYRCKASACMSSSLPAIGAPRVHVSPDFSRSGLVLAATDRDLFVSRDGGFTFSPVSLAALDGIGIVHDVLFPSMQASRYLMLATHGSDWGRGGILISADTGESWRQLGAILIEGFRHGAKAAIATPDGRVIALGTSRGIACTTDGGSSWRSRCTA